MRTGRFEARIAAPNGREAVLRIIGAGDVFGDLALVLVDDRRD